MTNTNVQQIAANEFRATRGNSSWMLYKLGNDWIVEKDNARGYPVIKMFRSLEEVEANCKSFKGVAHLAANPLIAI